MTKHQNLFVALVNMDIFPMTLQFSIYSLLTNKCNLFVYADMQNVYRCMQCLHHWNYY